MNMLNRLLAVTFVWALFGQAVLRAAPPAGAYNLYEVKNEKTHTLRYEVIAQAEAGGAASNDVDAQGDHWRLVSTFATKTAADKRRGEMEKENLVWGVFKVKSPAGDERYAMERVSKNHPKKASRGGESWTLMRKCDSEEKAREAVAKENEKEKEKK